MELKRKEKEALLAGLGARVRALRLEADLTVSAFAKRASLSPRFINQLEAGTGNISVVRLAQVAAALGRALPELLPPPEADHSLRAEVWRSLADCGDGDLHELRQWLAVRNGRGATPRYIALIGILNAGKSTVGPLLSRQLKTDFVELDHEIEEAAGMPLADLFATHGEGYYRTLEHEALARLFATSRGGVFAPGGSVVTDPESWSLVKQRCFTIWLHATPEEAAGMPLADLFATHGEGYYRTLEHEALARLFATSRGGVFAPGGSVVTDPESWNLVKQRCFTIWLHATPEELMKRTKRKGNQRLLNRPSVMADLKSLLARREPLYAESKLTIKTTGKAPAKIMQEILNALPSGI